MKLSDEIRALRLREIADEAIEKAWKRSEAMEHDLSAACVNCRHWEYVEGTGCPVVRDEDPKKHERAWGLCRRYPRKQEPQPNGGLEHLHPPTDYYDRCGEFSPAFPLA